MKRTILSVMLMLGGATAALAHEGPRSGTVEAQAQAQAHVQHSAQLAAKLGLDARQATAVSEATARYRDQIAPLREDARVTRRSLAGALKVSTPDGAKVAQLTSQLVKDRLQMRKLRDDKQAELQRLLTPEQYAKLMLRHGGGVSGRRRHGERTDRSEAPSARPAVE